MDRVEQLSELARAYLACEETIGNGDRELGRQVTRHRLFWDAVDLKFDPVEINEAIDAILLRVAAKKEGE